MVLHKFLMKPYLNNRYNAGLSQGKARGRKEGLEEADAEWQAWYNRMKEAESRGEEFDQLPPGFGEPQTKE